MVDRVSRTLHGYYVFEHELDALSELNRRSLVSLAVCVFSLAQLVVGIWAANISPGWFALWLVVVGWSSICLYRCRLHRAAILANIRNAASSTQHTD